ncbi:MAG TPA: hypothetical protein VFP78_18480 [Solirubrobacteraceae bacterium]|nr:hypothetical protein [Solirubrobacteraceae bacterium]
MDVGDDRDVAHVSACGADTLGELGEQSLDPLADVVTDPSHAVEVGFGGVVDLSSVIGLCEAVHEERHEVLQPRTAERLERLGHGPLDRLGRERAGELVTEVLEPLFKVPPGDQIDVELGQSGCHRSGPPASASASSRIVSIDNLRFNR